MKRFAGRSTSLWKAIRSCAPPSCGEGLEEPLQVVHKKVDVPWDFQDWRGLPEERLKERLESLLATYREEGFDLSRPPLMRLSLIRVGDEAYFFHWSTHHILLDGWSGPLLRNELFDRYLALVAGREASPPRPRPYRDFIAWLGEQDPVRAERFWRRQLAGYREPVSLGLAPASTRVKRGAERYSGTILALKPQTAARLRRLITETHLTANTLVQAAWALLLTRMSGLGDVVFGATVSGRSAPLEGLESMVGLFINTLPVRARTDPESSFTSWVRDFQKDQVEAREYEHTSLMMIQKWSDVPASRQLFESIVVFENYPTDIYFSVAGEDSTSEAPEPPPASPPAGESRVMAHTARQFERTSYPLTMIVNPVEDRWIFQFGFDLRVFEPSTAERIASTLGSLFEGLADGFRTRIRDLPTLSAAEREQLLVAWNDTGVEPPRGVISELFEHQSRKTPEAVAVVFESERLTYQQLDREADLLAHHLSPLGVGAEDRVALFVERCPKMVVALFAVLKTGGAYLPLDPRTPRERLAFMLADARVKWVLTQESLQESLPPSPAPVLSLDTGDRASGGSAQAIAAAAAAGNQLAYLIYTSGSTGRPKAVMVEQSSLADYSCAAASTAGIEPADRVLQFASISFDTMAEEVYPCLIRGATLVLRTDRMLEFPLFLEACRERNLTVLDLPTAYWHELTRYMEAEALELPPSIRLVILGGEKAEPEVIATWHGLVGDGVVLVNTYGPTEATIVSTQHAITEAPVPKETADGPVWPEVAIGRPRANARAYVLDGYLEPVAPGIAGVLYVAGSGVARGYFDRPALTARAFSPALFSSAPGGRLYCTGDRVRFREDWNLEFLGRIDHQVKLRGFRVELGEIEAVLEAHEAVREATVVVRQEKDPAASVLLRGRGKAGSGTGRATLSPAISTARLHVASGLGGARRSASNVQRQGGPRRPSRAR